MHCIVRQFLAIFSPKHVIGVSVCCNLSKVGVPFDDVVGVVVVGDFLVAGVLLVGRLQ